MPMRILGLEPYYGGSHQAFLDGWIRHSKHDWQLLTLPDHQWKWRMRHAAITLSQQANQLYESGDRWDAIWASDMLSLAEFQSLAVPHICHSPSVLFFHENQFTYPNQTERERDYHYGFSNYVACLAADQVWFNSSFHQTDFLTAVRKFLKRMPDHQDLQNVDRISQKCQVQYPGIDDPDFGKQQDTQASSPQSLKTILWSARWEHDKNPELFFEALRQIKSQGSDFQLILLGQHSDKIPTIFEQAAVEFQNEIVFSGYAESREEYYRLVQRSDLIVSTALHEFFGISVMEAMSQGVIPILPNRLSYPELLFPLPETARHRCLYDGSLNDLVHKLTDWFQAKNTTDMALLLKNRAAAFNWKQRAVTMDLAMERAVESSPRA